MTHTATSSAGSAPAVQAVEVADEVLHTRVAAVLEQVPVE